MLGRIALVAHVLGLIYTVYPVPRLKIDEPPNLEGIWYVVGEEKGESYDGTVRLKKLRDTYICTWSIVGGGDDAVGVAVLEKGQLVIGWRSGARAFGLHIMSISGKTIEGRWYSPANGGAPNKETWTLLKKP